MVQGLSIRKCAKLAGISIDTSFKWRHKILNAWVRVWIIIDKLKLLKFGCIWSGQAVWEWDRSRGEWSNISGYRSSGFPEDWNSRMSDSRS